MVNVNRTQDERYIDKMGNFFEWNKLHERFGWEFEWFLNRCATGNPPHIPSYNWPHEPNKAHSNTIT